MSVSCYNVFTKLRKGALEMTYEDFMAKYGPTSEVYSKLFEAYRAGDGSIDFGAYASIYADVESHHDMNSLKLQANANKLQRIYDAFCQR